MQVVRHRPCGISILAEAQSTAGTHPQTPHLTWKLVLPWAPRGWTRDLQKVPFRLNYLITGSELCFWAKLPSMGMPLSSCPWVHTLCLSLLPKLRIRAAHPPPFCFPWNKSAWPGGQTELWGLQSAWCGLQGPAAAAARAPSHQREAHTPPAPHLQTPAEVTSVPGSHSSSILWKVAILESLNSF